MAHPTAVLPLRRLGLPMIFLVVGSMVPDVPVFLGWWGVYGITHSLLGVVTVDVVLALGVVALWAVAMRDAVVDLAPDWVRSRLAPSVRPTRREWLLAPISAAIGAATHVAWDSFTHPGAWGPAHVEWLRTEHLGPLGVSLLGVKVGAVRLGGRRASHCRCGGGALSARTPAAW